MKIFLAFLFTFFVVLSSAQTYIPHEMVIGVDRNTTVARGKELANAVGGYGLRKHDIMLIKLPERANLQNSLNRLQSAQDVKFSDYNYVRSPDFIPNDPYWSYEWHLTKINCPTAWDVTTGSTSVVIAIVDTGCDPTQPDLVTNYVPGYNFYK